MITNTHVTLKSANAKTGPITTTGRPRATCPITCTFNPENPEGVGGCYTVGRIDAMYTRLARDWSYEELREFLLDGKTDRLRDRVDGDVLTDGDFDREYLYTLTDAALAAGYKWVFGYTHVPEVTVDDVPHGYTMNVSCETESDVEQAADRGLPIVISNDTTQHGDKIAGRRVIQCPKTRVDSINCGNCGGSAGPICARADREQIVLFPLHGGGAKKAAKSIEMKGV